MELFFVFNDVYASSHGISLMIVMIQVLKLKLIYLKIKPHKTKLYLNDSNDPSSEIEIDLS